MTAEIIAIVTVGVALAGVILTSARGVRQDIITATLPRLLLRRGVRKIRPV